jgi:endo-1,4-beta-xylanase
MALFLCTLLLPFSVLPAEDGLAKLAHARHFNLGVCAPVNNLRNNQDGGRYIQAITDNATMVEPENDLKPPALWLGLGQYNFTNADFLLGAPGEKGWVAQHNLKLRGHVLVYARDEGYTIPRWLLNMESQIDAAQAKQILHDYIFAVAGRYKGKVAMWDVINEAIEDRPNNRPFQLRNSFWFRKLGPEFLVLAFKYAHEADPKAELYYNEYGVEGGGPKAEALLQLADYLKAQHALVTGLGLQYHTGMYERVVAGDGHYALLDQIKRRNLSFMITELDFQLEVQQKPRTDPEYGVIVKNPEDLQEQAKRVGTIFNMALSYPNCHGIQFWGITDKYSWIPQFQPGKGAALLLDYNYERKPMWHAVEAALKRR